MQIAEVEAEARRLLNALADDLPGDLGHMARTTLRAAGHDPLSSTLAAPANPIPWAPRVLALCCQAYDRPAAMAVPVAACFELLGIVSAVLDAAQDGHHDRIRAYVEALPDTEAGDTAERVGPALVSNMGVALIGLAWHALLAHGPRYGLSSSTILEIGRLISTHWGTICHAQHLDLTIGRSPHLSLAEYTQIVAGKAGAIGGTVCEAGAILTGADVHRALWRTLGMERTIAQQLGDDCKDLERDLANGHQLGQPVLYGLMVADARRREMLLALLTQVRAGGSEAAAARQALIDALTELGGVHYTLGCLALHREQAFDALHALALPHPIHEELRQWVLDSIPTQHSQARPAFDTVRS